MSDAETESDDPNYTAPHETEAERVQSEERKKQRVAKASGLGQNTPAKEHGLKRAKPDDEPVTGSKAGKTSTTLAQRTDPATDASVKGRLFKKGEEEAGEAAAAVPALTGWTAMASATATPGTAAGAVEKPPVCFAVQPELGDPNFFRNIDSLKKRGAGWSPALLVFGDTPDTLKQAGDNGKWFIGAGWPANSDAFYDKYGSMQPNGAVQPKFLREIQKWRANGSQPGSVYATCDPAPPKLQTRTVIGPPQPS